MNLKEFFKLNKQDILLSTVLSSVMLELPRIMLKSQDIFLYSFWCDLYKL